MTTKPYPLFRLPGKPDTFRSGKAQLIRIGWHRTSIAYTSDGNRRYNQAFIPTSYGPEYVQGDVIGVGYRPRTGSLFFTRNGKKLEDIAHGLKSQNFFPTVGANGPCTVHVNFGQNGFVFIEANVKKWGLAPMTGSLAPPPPYGSEQGSILLEAGGNDLQHISQQQQQQQAYPGSRHGRSRSRFGPMIGGPTSPGPIRSPTDISLAQLVHIPSQEDLGEGTSRLYLQQPQHGLGIVNSSQQHILQNQDLNNPPPEYTSPEQSIHSSSDDENGSDEDTIRPQSPRPPAPSYDIAIGSTHPDNVESELFEAVQDFHSSHQN